MNSSDDLGEKQVHRNLNKLTTHTINRFLAQFNRVGADNFLNDTVFDSLRCWIREDSVRHKGVDLGSTFSFELAGCFAHGARCVTHVINNNAYLILHIANDDGLLDLVVDLSLLVHHGQADLALVSIGFEIRMKIFSPFDSSGIRCDDAKLSFVCDFFVEEINCSESCPKILPDHLSTSCTSSGNGMQIESHDIANTHELDDLGNINGTHRYLLVVSSFGTGVTIIRDDSINRPAASSFAGGDH